MSDAALRSSKTKHIIFLLSVAVRISSLSFNILVFYADCSSCVYPGSFVLSVICSHATFCMSLDMYDKFDTGQKFLKISSRLIFLSKGLNVADLKFCEYLPVYSDMFITAVIMGNTRSASSLRSDIGKGYGLQLFSGDSCMNLHTSVFAIGLMSQTYMN